MRANHILFDGDVLVYRAACAVESIYWQASRSKDNKEYLFSTKSDLNSFLKGVDSDSYVISNKQIAKPFEEALSLVWEIMAKTLHDTNADGYTVILSDLNRGNIFRHKIYPAYKENRKDNIKPVHKDALIDAILNDELGNHVLTSGIEADDEIGILMTEDDRNLSASVDKDLLQIPGLHYNLMNRQFTNSCDPGELWLEGSNLKGYGSAWMYAQMMMGDGVDNIKGLKGYGPVKTYKYLSEISPENYEHKVRNIFMSEENESFDLTKALVKILRER